MSLLPAIRCVMLSLIVALAGCGGGGGTPGSSAPGNVGLSWLPPTTNTDGSPLHDLAGYYVYVGTDPSSLGRLIAILDPMTTTSTVKGLTPGTWYFAVTAVNSSGSESTYSRIISKTIH